MKAIGFFVTVPVAWVFGVSGEAWGLDKGFSKALKQMEIKPSSGTDSTWMVLVLVGVVLGVVLLIQLYNRISAQPQKTQAKAGKKKKKVNFTKYAAKLGFKIAEIKTLRILASRISPQDPGSLLTTDAGRERLASDIWERIRKREREIEVLRGIEEKLKMMRDHEMQERATVRVETDLPVWIVKKSGPANEPEGEEDIFSDVEQIGGRLLDLSEGGAALAANLDVGTNDLIELWSADSEIWIPPVTAVVLSSEQKPESETPIFHLHFLDPPLGELRAAIQTLQLEAGVHSS